MTKENAKAFLPLVQALADGKQIQRRVGASEWIYEPMPFIFESNPKNYRVTPELVLRPWTPDEVPLGARLRVTNLSYRSEAIILAVNGEWVTHSVMNGVTSSSVIALFSRGSGIEVSTDGGHTWGPCGTPSKNNP